jgi:hypothetical protein
VYGDSGKNMASSAFQIFDKIQFFGAIRIRSHFFAGYQVSLFSTPKYYL